MASIRAMPYNIVTMDRTKNGKPLIETNPHLKVSAKYRKALIANVSSSTAVETGAPVDSIARTLSQREKAKPVKRPRGSAR